MSETIGLSELQIKRRELENELASLSQKEKSLESDLRTLEEKIIDQLKDDIKAKNSVLNNLESRKSDLEKKLSELQGKPAGSQTAEEQNTEENDTELTVVGYQPE
jgi:chromosome segregation ATPase